MSWSCKAVLEFEDNKDLCFVKLTREDRHVDIL